MSFHYALVIFAQIIKNELSGKKYMFIVKTRFLYTEGEIRSIMLW